MTGGVPRYLEEVLSNQNAEQNAERLCFIHTPFTLVPSLPNFESVRGRRPWQPEHQQTTTRLEPGY